jgi:hypothetical protein
LEKILLDFPMPGKTTGPGFQSLENFARVKRGNKFAVGGAFQPREKN